MIYEPGWPTPAELVKLYQEKIQDHRLYGEGNPSYPECQRVGMHEVLKYVRSRVNHPVVSQNFDSDTTGASVGDDTLGPVLDAAVDEVGRQQSLHGTHAVNGYAHTEYSRLSVLTEEVGEVARVLNELFLGHESTEETYEKLYDELVQVAAVTLSWAATVRPPTR